MRVPKKKDLYEKIIKENTETGIGISVLCRKYKISHTSIREMMKLNNIKSKTRINIRSTQEKKETHKEKIFKEIVEENHKTGISLKILCEKYGVNHGSVRNWMARHNINAITKSYKMSKTSKQIIIEKKKETRAKKGTGKQAYKYYINNNISKVDACLEFDLHPSTLTQYMKRHNLPDKEKRGD